MIVANAVGIALFTANYELAKQLVEAGAPFSLGDPIMLQFYNMGGAAHGIR